MKKVTVMHESNTYDDRKERHTVRPKARTTRVSIGSTICHEQLEILGVQFFRFVIPILDAHITTKFAKRRQTTSQGLHRTPNTPSPVHHLQRTPTLTSPQRYYSAHSNSNAPLHTNEHAKSILHTPPSYKPLPPSSLPHFLPMNHLPTNQLRKK